MEISGYSRIIKSLELLASEPEYQEEYLRRLGTSPLTDELALVFDDSYEFFKSSGKISHKKEECVDFLSLVDHINSVFDAMGDRSNTDVWHVNALKESEWTKIRELAKQALTTFPTFNA